MALQNYNPVELQRGKIFAAELKPVMNALKQIVMNYSDVAVLSYIRAIAVIRGLENLREKLNVRSAKRRQTSGCLLHFLCALGVLRG